jgi:hypothetical protein
MIDVPPLDCYLSSPTEIKHVDSWLLHPHPVDLHICRASQPLHQLAGVLLQVTNGVDLQPQLVEGQPVKARCSFHMQLWHALRNLTLAEGKIFEQGIPIVWLTDFRRCVRWEVGDHFLGFDFKTLRVLLITKSQKFFGIEESIFN